MSVGRVVQWAQHITAAQLAEYFGVKEPSRLCLSGSF